MVDIPRDSPSKIGNVGASIDSLDAQLAEQEFNEMNKQALEQAAGAYYQSINTDSAERVSGFPMPELYNQHYINKYSFPKGLICQRKPEE